MHLQIFTFSHCSYKVKVEELFLCLEELSFCLEELLKRLNTLKRLNVLRVFLTVDACIQLTLKIFRHLVVLNSNCSFHFFI